ncbi:MAG: glycosyltransferase family 39 protein [Chloroflexota bacterium]
MRRNVLIPIVALLLLAAAVRIVNVSHWPVWTDEGWSTWAASDHRIEVILDKVAQDRHPPLYFLSLSAWWTIAGYSRLALRFLAIASGLLAVAVVYRIGYDWFDRRTGIYAALLLAMLDVAIYYSQEIRHYGWLVLAVSLMTLFFLRYLRRPRTTLWIAYMLSVAFMFYSLYIGVLVLAIQIVIGLLFWRATWRDKAKLASAWIAAVILYIPWLVVLSRQLSILTGGIDGYPTNLATLLTVSQILFGGQLALTVSLYVLGLWQIAQRRDGSIRWLAQITIVACGVGLLALMFIANFWIGMLSARTLVYLVPMLAVICGYGLSLLPTRIRGVLTVMIIVIALATTDFSQPRLESNAIAQALAKEYTPGDLVVLENGWDDNAVRYEVMLALPDGESAEIIRTLPWVDNRGDPNVPVVPQIEASLKTHRRVWVVNWFQPPQVIPFLNAGGDGFLHALTSESSTGAQYRLLYNDPMMRAVLFEQPNLNAPTHDFGNLLALHDVLFSSHITPGSALHVDLWWSALKPLPLDYSTSVFLMDSKGTLLVQADGPPGDVPTSQWIPDKPMFDRHTLTIPPDFPTGSYKLAVQVYWYGDRKPLPVNGADTLIVGEITIQNTIQK